MAKRSAPPRMRLVGQTKVEMLSGGWFTSAAGIWRRDDDMDRQVRFPYLGNEAARGAT